MHVMIIRVLLVLVVVLLEVGSDHDDENEYPQIEVWEPASMLVPVKVLVLNPAV